MRPKRLILILLCLVLVLPAQAISRPVEAFSMLKEGEQILGMCAYEGGLLVNTTEGLYRYVPGLEPQTVHSMQRVLMSADPLAFGPLMTDGARVYGYHPMLAAVVPLSLLPAFEVGDIIPLDLKDMTHGDEVLQVYDIPSQALLHEGRFYLLFDTDEKGDMAGRLLSFDLTGKDRREHDVPRVRRLAPYTDGRLLLMQEEDGIKATGQAAFALTAGWACHPAFSTGAGFSLWHGRLAGRPANKDHLLPVRQPALCPG